MTVNDLRQKYIGKLFSVNGTSNIGKCIQVNGYSRDDKVVVRFCLHLDKGNLWFSSDEILPVKETLF